MRYLPILFFVGLSTAQNLVPGAPIERIAVDAGGSIYVAQVAYVVPSPLAAPASSTITKLNQWTAKVSFPVSSLSVGAKVVAAGTSSVAMLDPGSGNILSSSAINIPAGVLPQWVVVTAAGNIVLSGNYVGSALATLGALNIPGQETYLMKLDPTGKMLWAAQGIGGAVTVDSGENIYVAGSSFVGTFPTTANAFQATAPFNFCEGGGGILAPAFPCPQQYIAKVSPDGSTLLFATYLSGTLGASPADIELGPDGSIYTAGSVQATDYPVTGGALIGAMQAKFVNTLCECMVPILGYAASGYVSRISADGSKLLYSTYLGGSQADNATAIGVGADGSMVVGGVSSSPDFPGLPAQLGDCEPGNSLLGTKSREFFVQISADGSKITNAQLIGGTNPGTGIACITDAADGAFADVVSPGQLITINGIGVGPAVSGAPGIGSPATQIGGVSVTFDGIPAGLTAAGGTIVTAAVPFAVAGKQLTTMTLMQNGQTFDSRQLYVAGETPSVFVLAPNGKACNTLPQVAYGAFTGGSPTPSPMILNADGTINACDNPAAEGSAVTFFVNGTGIGTPPLMINSGSLSIFSQTAIGVQTSVNAVSVLVPPGSSNPLYVYYVSEGYTAAPDYRIAFGMPVYVK